MKINLANKHTYVPKWNNNQSLPAAEQVTIEFRYMTCAEEERFTQFVPKYKSDKKDEVELEVKTNANEIWDLCVQKVTGLSGEDKELTDPKAVRNIPGTYSLITEMVGVIRRGLSEEEIKN